MTNFVTGEFYHVFNRGVDKRKIFVNQYDVERFLESMQVFNSVSPIGSLYEKSFEKKLGGETPKSERLVNFISYCLNFNHFHFILEQVSDGGISEFMKRMGGYTWYFNNKYKRTGALFAGTFKSRHIDSNEYLLHLSAYVNLNNRAHQLGGETPKLVRSSWDEYIGGGGSKTQSKNDLCDKGIILEQFRNAKEYSAFALESIQDIVERKRMKKEDEAIDALLLE